MRYLLERPRRMCAHHVVSLWYRYSCFQAWTQDAQPPCVSLVIVGSMTSPSVVLHQQHTRRTMIIEGPLRQEGILSVLYSSDRRPQHVYRRIVSDRHHESSMSHMLPLDM